MDILHSYIQNSILSFDTRTDTRFRDDREPLSDRIFRVLNQSKLRIGSIDATLRKMLRMKIELSLRQGKPITLIIATGWGKNWQVPSHPHADWAEFFHLKFLYQMMLPIVHIYEPGVQIEITPDDYAVKIINYFEDEWLQAYENDTRALLEFFNLQTPKNFRLSLKKSSDWYDFDVLQKQIEEKTQKLRNTLHQDLNLQQIIAQRLRNASNNLVLSQNTAKQRRFELAQSILRHQAWISIDMQKRQEYLEGGYHIPVLHRPIPGVLPIRNLPASLVQYWKGIGILRFSAKKVKYYQDIVSPAKWKTLEKQVSWVKTDPPQILNFLKDIPLV